MILVTGASRGIGFECARAFLARTDHPVMITGRNMDELERARAEVPCGARDRLLLRVSDQSKPEDVEALAVLIADPATRLDGAILAVGENPMYSDGPRRLHSVDRHTADAVIRTNCTHTLLLTGAILQRFRRQRRGTLAWIGSRAYQTGLPGAALYCATKAFLSGLAHTVHHEYAERGVRVHLVNPGAVRTPRTAHVIDGFAAAHGLAVEDAGDVAARIVTLFLCPDPQPVETNL